MDREEVKELAKYIVIGVIAFSLMCAFCFRQSDKVTTGGSRYALNYEQLMEVTGGE